MVLACDGGAAPTDATPSTKNDGTSTVAKPITAAPSTPAPTTAAKPAPSQPPPQAPTPTIALPELSDGADSRVPQDTAAIWITADALRVGRTGGMSNEVMPLSQGQLNSAEPEVLEPLAIELTDLRSQADSPGVAVSAIGGDAFVLFAANKVKAATLRRVLTTARATGYLSVNYAVTAANETKVLEVKAAGPVRPDKPQYEAPLVVWLADDGLQVNSRKFEHDAALVQINRQLAFRERKCVLFDTADDTLYGDWIAALASMAESGVDCITPYSAAASADYMPPPPPPPPPMAEDEDEGGPPPPVRPPPPTPPGTDRVEHWWAATLAADDAAHEAECKKHLAELQAEFAAEEPKLNKTLVLLTRLEDACGDQARVSELQRKRSELFPDDASGWLAIGMEAYDPLFPNDNDKGLGPRARFNAATQALAAFESGLEHSPDDRQLHLWAVMAYEQRERASEGAAPIDPKLHARVDAMKAWKHRQWLCEHGNVAGCVNAPQTEAEHARDLAALAKAAP